MRRQEPREQGWSLRLPAAWQSVVVVLVAAGLATRLALQVGTDLSQTVVQTWTTDAVVLPRVKRIAWSETNGSIKDIVAAGQPMIIEGAPTQTWPCASWTEESIQKNVDVFYGVKEQDASRAFRYYHETKPLRDLPQVQQQPLWRRTDLRTESFFARIRRSASSQFMYFSADLDSFPALRKDVPRREPMLQAPNTKEMLVNLWIAGNGVVADTHYDTSENIYFQIREEKRFILLPPAARRHLGTFPFLHPFYRQAVRPVRMNVTGDVDIEFVQSLGGLEAHLRPGEVLFVPSFWFHNVEAIAENSRAAISVNLWSDSKDYKTGEEFFSAPVPFEEDWTPEELVLGLNTFADMLLQSLAPEERQEVVRAMKAQYQNAVLSSSHSLGSLSFQSLQPQSVATINCDRGDESFKESLLQGAEGFAWIARRFSGPTIRTLYVGYFLEVLANYCVGTENVKAFVDHCLRDEV